MQHKSSTPHNPRQADPDIGYDFTIPDWKAQNAGYEFNSRSEALQMLDSCLLRVEKINAYLRRSGTNNYQILSKSQAEESYSNWRYRSSSGKHLPVFQEWLKWPQRAYIDDVNFRPDQDPLAIYKTAEPEPRYIFNLYRGPSIYEHQHIHFWLEDLGWTPEVLRSCSLTDLSGGQSILHQYLFQVFATREPQIDIVNYLLDYLAHLVQFPAQLPGTALLFIGAPGTGKSFFGNNIAAPLVGPGSFLQLPSSGLTGRWTGLLANRLLVMADDPHFPRDSEEAISSLKSIITERTFTFEKKYFDPWTTDNYLRMIINLNNNLSLRLDPNDRRFTIIRPSSAWLEDYDKFRKLHLFLYGNQIDDSRPSFSIPDNPQDGYAWLFYHWLKNRKIKHQLNQKLYTEAGLDFIRQSGNEVYTWLVASHQAAKFLSNDPLSSHPWSDDRTETIPKNNLFNYYQAWSKNQNGYSKTISQKRFFNEVRSYLNTTEGRTENSNNESVRTLNLPPRKYTKL